MSTQTIRSNPNNGPYNHHNVESDIGYPGNCPNFDIPQCSYQENGYYEPQYNETYDTQYDYQNFGNQSNEIDNQESDNQNFLQDDSNPPPS